MVLDVYSSEPTQTVDEESDHYDVESVVTSDDDSVSCKAVALQEEANNPLNFGNIAVTNSADVHFGNKTYYQGPVTIKQILYTSPATEETESDVTLRIKDLNKGYNKDNPGFVPDLPKNGTVKTEEEKQVSVQSSNQNKISRDHPLYYQHARIILIILFVLIVVIITILLPIYFTPTADRNLATTHPVDSNEQERWSPIGSPIDKVATACLNRHTLIIGVISIVIFIALVVFVSIFLFKRYAARKYIAEGTSEILRNFDSKLVHRIEWVAQPPDGHIPPLTLPVPYVILMDTLTANCTEKSKCVIHVRLLQMVHIEGRSWLDIGYNFLVGGDGLVYEGRGWKQEGAHTYGYNARSIGLAFIGTFVNSMPTAAQIETVQNIIKIGVDVGYIAADYKLLAAKQLIPDGGPGKLLYRNITTWPHWSPKP